MKMKGLFIFILHLAPTQTTQEPQRLQSSGRAEGTTHPLAEDSSLVEASVEAWRSYPKCQENMECLQEYNTRLLFRALSPHTYETYLTEGQAWSDRKQDQYPIGYKFLDF